jgi:hypothetical protein
MATVFKIEDYLFILGEAITGGEVVRGGRQISFDVIANVRKIVRSGGSQRVSYEVTVRRMNCLPDPPEPEVSCKSLFFD